MPGRDDGKVHEVISCYFSEEAWKNKNKNKNMLDCFPISLTQN